jgi:HEAT repeat protein
VERRAEAARLLGVLGDKSVVPALRWCLDDPAPAVQLEAALALIALFAADAPDRALVGVALGLGHPGVPTAARCADALVAAGDRSIPHILAAAPPRSQPATRPRRPSDDALQVMAIEVLERLGTPAGTGAIEGYLQDRSGLVRARANRALRRLGSVAVGGDVHRGVGI